MSAVMEVYLAFRGKPGISYAAFTCPPAERTFSGPCALSWMGHEFRFFPLPGHSPGGTGILLDGERFFSGDYLLPGEEVILRFPGGNDQQYYEETEPFLEKLPGGLWIYPGHGDAYVLDRP